jgi:hypothetical protein
MQQATAKGKMPRISPGAAKPLKVEYSFAAPSGTEQALNSQSQLQFTRLPESTRSNQLLKANI